jgi:hypothetical protein
MTLPSADEDPAERTIHGRWILIVCPSISLAMGTDGAPTLSSDSTGTDSDGRRPPPRSLVIVVVILLAVMVLLATLSLRIFVEVKEGPASHIKDGLIVVDGDEVWEGRTGVLKNPVEVRSSGSLTIRECDLRLEMERLLVGMAPWFHGETGSEIVVEESSITVTKDPSFEGIVVLNMEWYLSYDQEHGMAMAWRAVDLRTSTRPVLTLDVNPLGRYGDLLVAVQPSPGESLEAVDTITLEKDVDDGWETFTIGLSDYAGGIVGLSLSTTNLTMSGLLLRNVRVTDPVSDPRGEAFPTGNLVDDGWWTDGFDTMETWLDKFDLDYLISTEGDITLVGADLTAPNAWWDDGRNVGEAAKTRLSSGPQGYNTISLIKASDVRVWGGSVHVEDCVLDNVTLDASYSEVVIDGSRFVADREMVTLFHCWGEMTDSTFGFANWIDPDDAWDYMENPDLWAVSIWGLPNDLREPALTEPFLVSGCEFRHSLIGLDLAHTLLNLEDCLFDNITWIGLWAHDSAGLGTWEEVSASNRFHDCHQTRFLETHDYTITFHHDDRPSRDSPSYPNNHAYVIDEDGGWMPTFDNIWPWSTTAEMYMPTTYVNTTGEVFRPEWVEVRLTVGWAGTAVERVPTDATERIVDFTGRNEDGTYDGEDERIRWPSIYPGNIWSNSTGEVELDIYVQTFRGSTYYTLVPVRDLELELRMDGALLSTIDLEKGAVPDRWGDLQINTTLDVPRDLHNFNFTLTGVLNETSERTCLNGWDFSIARGDPNTTHEDLLGWLDEEFPALLMDPGTEYALTTEEIPDGDPYDYYYWKIMLGEGSTFTFSGPPLDGFEGMYIRADGPGGLVLNDLELQYISFGLENGWARISNVSSEYFDMDVLLSDVLVEDCSLIPSYSYLVLSNVTFRRCHLILSRTDWWLVSQAPLSFIDCDIGGALGDIRLSVGDDVIRLIDTTIRDMNVTFAVGDSSNGTLEVSGCDLGGKAGFINLTGQTYWSPGTQLITNASRVTISGNVFSGPNSGVSAESWLFEDGIHGNVLEEGAGYRRWYNTSLELMPANATDRPWSYELRYSPGQGSVFDDHFRTYYWDLTYIVCIESKEAEPTPEAPTVQVTVEREGTAYWFDVIDLGGPPPTIQVPDWGDHVSMLQDLLRSFSDNFWED